MNQGCAVLTDVLDAPHGSILVLDNDDSVPTDIPPTALDQYLRRYGYSPLAELCQQRSTEVYYARVQMSELEWTMISDVLRDSDRAKELRDCPAVFHRLQLPYLDVVRLPYRLYGGIGSPRFRWGPTLYTSAPYDFRLDTNAKQPWYLLWQRSPWYYCLLSAPGWRVFRTRINIRTHEVEIEAGTVQDHFLEP